jgi:hypothetical protein
MTGFSDGTLVMVRIQKAVRKRKRRERGKMDVVGAVVERREVYGGSGGERRVGDVLYARYHNLLDLCSFDPERPREPVQNGKELWSTVSHLSHTSKFDILTPLLGPHRQVSNTKMFKPTLSTYLGLLHCQYIKRNTKGYLPTHLLSNVPWLWRYRCKR